MPTIVNTNASVSAKTVTVNENNDTITGLKTFNRGAAAPFAVDAASTKVANLDADKLDGIDGAALVKKDGTVAMTGTLDLGAIGKIQFPAVQSPSAGVNVLDDYEEGTFTPTIVSTGGGVPTYSQQIGTYTKVGRQVTFLARPILATFGTLAAGSITIAGLPFASNATATTHMPVYVGFFSGFTTPIYFIYGYIVPGATSVTINIVSVAGTTSIALAKADMSAVTDMMVAGTYFAAN